MYSRNIFKGAGGGISRLKIQTQWKAALMIFLNVKVREHKEAQLDIIRGIVHRRVDDKNVSKKHDWGSNSDQTIKAAPWHNEQECSSCENYVRPHSAATCSGYFKAFAPRDINNNLFTLEKQLPHRRFTLNTIRGEHWTGYKYSTRFYGVSGFYNSLGLI